MQSRLFEVRKPACSLHRSRIVRGEFFADIIEDCRIDPQIVFCVIQQRGSPEVLFLGQFYTVSEAEAAAHHYISDYQSRLRDPIAS